MEHPAFLIADDTPGKQYFLRALLKRSGWPGDVLTASTTEEAITLIDAHPSLVAAFVDYRMPGAGGLPIIRHLRERNPRALIALITASSGDIFEREAREAGADAFLSTAYPEPYVVERIQGLLKEWMGVGSRK